MKNFKLTIKKLDNSEEFQDLSNKIMTHLRKDFGLQDDESFANMTLLDLLGGDLKTLSLLVNGNDFQSSIDRLGELKLVGDQYGISDDFCPKCGSPDWCYTGGMMLCSNCEHSEEAPENYLEGDIADYSGRVVL